jgi:hypothetical protein
MGWGMGSGGGTSDAFLLHLALNCTQSGHCLHLNKSKIHSY